ncbi:SDR family oxidoreductase [Nocardia tengchongensis]|uniref:SDR family oxidoreductase n=1 Tax=Nocardia tengchongensis TaxID=2055889 RepID=UPI0036B7C184
MARFTDRTVIVTGAAQGIGAAYARALAAEGAKVVVADLNSEAGETVAKKITADGGTAVFARVDVADPESAEAVADFTIAEFGGINHLVNNAAIYAGMKIDLLVSVPWDYYKKFMSVNLDGALNMTRAVYKHIAQAGGGSIVNQSSTAAWTYSGFYGLAKVGINGLTQQLAHELGHSKIRVNAIAPGPTDTEATRSIVPEQFVDELVKQMALKRLGTTEDMVGACLYLLSDDAAWVTGQVLNVDGGQVFRS